MPEPCLEHRVGQARRRGRELRQVRSCGVVTTVRRSDLPKRVQHVGLAVTVAGLAVDGEGSIKQIPG